jgi:hypothetical protein
MPVSQFRILCCFLYPGSASPSAALLLSFLFIDLEYRMLKRVFRVRAAPDKDTGTSRRRGKAKKEFPVLVVPMAPCGPRALAMLKHASQNIRNPNTPNSTCVSVRAVGLCSVSENCNRTACRQRSANGLQKKNKSRVN